MKVIGPTTAERVEPFLTLLRPGRENATSSYKLARQLKVSQRGVGFIAQAARDVGHLVGSVAGKGYFLMTDDPEDLRVTADHLSIRARAGLERVDRLIAQWNSFYYEEE
jgi:biotin operon repressor